jgi:putative ABC transport system permease protein
MQTAVIAILVTSTRLLLHVLLLAHPREFRRQFQAHILDDVAEDIQGAGTAGTSAAIRASAAAIGDAVRGLRSTTPRLAQLPRGNAPGSVAGIGARASASTWLLDVCRDLRFSVRGILREPAFSAAIIVTLALGIGVNAAMFGVVDRLLLQGPEHVREPERVRRLQIAFQPAGRDLQRNGWFGYTTYKTLRAATAFEAVAAYSITEDGAVLGRGIDARRINLGEATAGLFPLLGVTPELGRFYTEAEDDPIAPQRVVVIGYGLWQRDFGGRHDVIGQPITIDNSTYSIVGVAPKGFTGPDLVRVDVWMPESLLGRGHATNWTAAWNAWWLQVVARMNPGVTAAAADAEATALFRSAYVGSDTSRTKASLSVQPLFHGRDGLESMESRVSTWLWIVAGIVLLVACANVINLVLAHQIRQRREVAVRLALGASRGRVIQLLLTEALTLSLAGGAAGLAVAYGVGTFMRRWLIPGIEWSRTPADVRVLALSIIMSVIAGLAVGLLPAWRATAPGLIAFLKTGVREGGGRRSRTRVALTMAQAALSALLLVGSGLFVVSLERIRAMDLGLQPDRVLTFTVQRSGMTAITDPAERQRERERRAAFYPTVLERLRQRPDVEAASLAIGLAFSSGFGDDIHVPGRDTIPQLKGGGPYLNAVSADYFRTVGTRIVRGRAFTSSDRAGTAPVAIVNETMAAALWPNDDPIGKCFSIGQSPACAEIVGIAVDTRRFKLREDPAMAFYIPLGQEQGIGGTQLLVRPRGDASHTLAEVRQLLISLDPVIIFVHAAILQDRVEPQVRPWQLGATMFSLMGFLALVVATLGLYSLLSYLVTHRAHEIGVRMALGARPADIARLVVREGLALTVGGVVAGFGLAIAASGLVEPLLFDTSPREPVVFVAVAMALLATAGLATLRPAARARRVNPVDAMRTE